MLEDIRRSIEDLKVRREKWVRELRDPSSAMQVSDVRFLDRQIEKLARLERKVDGQLHDAARQLDNVHQAIKEHMQGW